MIGQSLGPTVMLQLGSFQFSITTAAYQELRRRTEYRWASQDRFGKMPALQFTGPGADAITLTGTIYTEFRGGTGQLEALRNLAALGLPQLLVDGTGSLLGRWVIEGVEEGQSVFAGQGVARKQQFTVNIRKRQEDAALTAIASAAASATGAAASGSASTLAQAKGKASSFLDSATSTVSSAISSMSNAIKTVQDRAQQIGNAVAPVVSTATSAVRAARDMKQQIDSTKDALKNINSLGNLQSAMYSVMSTASTATQASTVAANAAKALGVNLQASGADPQTIKAVASSEASFGRGAVAAVNVHSGASNVASSGV